MRNDEADQGEALRRRADQAMAAAVAEYQAALALDPTDREARAARERLAPWTQPRAVAEWW